MSNSMNKFILFFSLFSFSFSLSHANDQQELVERSKIALQSLMGDEGYKNNLASLLDRAKGVIIIPALYKAGFIIGGEGGNGVVLSKLPNGEWSYPSFVTFAGGSVGLQIGFESSEVVLTIMTDKGMKTLMNNSFTLGADVSIAAGPVGAGLSAQTTANFGADIYSFCHSKGLFGGGSLKGSVINAKDSWNEAYYNNQDVTPEQILLARGFKNTGAEPLRGLLKVHGIYEPKPVQQGASQPSYRPISQKQQSQNTHQNTQAQKNQAQTSNGTLRPEDQYDFGPQDKGDSTDGSPKELLPWQRG